MVPKKDHGKMIIKTQIEDRFYESMVLCVEKMGYSSLAEFIRLSIREKINRECGEHFIENVEVIKE